MNKLTANVSGDQVERLGPGEYYAICNRIEDGQVVKIYGYAVSRDKSLWARVSKWHWPDQYDYDQQDAAYMIKGKVARWLPMDALYVYHDGNGGIDDHISMG